MLVYGRSGNAWVAPTVQVFADSLAEPLVTDAMVKCSLSRMACF